MNLVTVYVRLMEDVEPTSCIAQERHRWHSYYRQAKDSEHTQHPMCFEL